MLLIALFSCFGY